MEKINLTNEEEILVGKLFSVLVTSGKNYNMNKIYDAFVYACEMHEGQFRNSGEPYIVHPISVAEIAAALGLELAWLHHHDSADNKSNSEDDDVLQVLLNWAAAASASWLSWGWSNTSLSWGWNSRCLSWSRHSVI